MIRKKRTERLLRPRVLVHGLVTGSTGHDNDRPGGCFRRQAPRQDPKPHGERTRVPRAAIDGHPNRPTHPSPVICACSANRPQIERRCMRVRVGSNQYEPDQCDCQNNDAGHEEPDPPSTTETHDVDPRTRRRHAARTLPDSMRAIARIKRRARTNQHWSRETFADTRVSHGENTHSTIRGILVSASIDPVSTPKSHRAF